MATKEAILITILSIFVVLGITLPFINQAFQNDETTINTEGFEFTQGQEVGFQDVVFSLFTMFFWTFGNLPFWLDGLFIIPRVMLGVIIFQLIRGS